VPYDLEDYWAHVYPEVTEGQQWLPVHGLEAYTPDNPADMWRAFREGVMNGAESCLDYHG
jgi:hypothetical protein